jgi:phosphate transport system substrate-binding protein
VENFTRVGLILICLLAAGDAVAKTMKIGGTGAVTEFLRQIGPAFTAKTGIPLTVIPSLGSGGGNAAVADGVLDLSVSGRELNDKEQRKGLTVASAFRSPFGLVTSLKQPAQLKSADIAGVYSAGRPAWPDGTPIRIILRPTTESDTQLLGRLFPGMTEALAEARTRPDLSVAATDQDNVEAAERTEGSLVGATLTQILTEKSSLRFVSIDGVQPSLANLASGAYPFSKTMYFVAPASRSVEADAFLAFINSPEGVELLRAAGNVASRE